MPIRVPVQAVQVVRNKKLVTAPIGKPFEFTAEEIDDIKRLNPEAVRYVQVDGEDAATAAEKAEAEEGKQKSNKKSADL